MLHLTIASYLDLTGNYSAQSENVQKVLDKAATELNEVLVTKDVSLDLALFVDASMTAVAAASVTYPSYVPGLTPVTLNSHAQNKVLTGVDGNGSLSDATVILSPQYMAALALWLANPSSSASAWVDEGMEHEILHAIGMNGTRNRTTGENQKDYLSLFDSFVQIENGRPYFNGPSAVGILGGKVPLAPFGTGSAIYHVDNKAMAELQKAIMGPAIPSDAKELDVELAIFNDVGFDIAKTLVSMDGKTFIPGANADIVNGTANIDRAIYSGKKADYTITSNDANAINIRAIANATDVDTLQSIERIQFADVALAFDANGQGGQAYRLYQAAFARKPDSTGLGFWMEQMRKGMTLTDAAWGFINSPEFKTKYGANPSNQEFVTLLYQNVLHRAPDEAGYAHWTKALENGTSRADALIGFGESLENKAQIILSSTGNEAKAYRMYQAAFDRTPDLGGLIDWISQMDKGLSLNEVASRFIASDEFKGMYGTNPTNAAFVTKLYSNVLDRSPDASGFANWENALNAGSIDQAQALTGFSESAENRMKLELTGLIKNGFEFTPVG